ncbi:TPA: capsid protein [Enterobacter cloacae]|nr:capsid protein [Enterobacter cloacae]
MTDNVYTPDQFRPHWGGVDADNDIHIEAYDRDVQTRLEAKSVFLAEGLSTYKPLKSSNQYRVDRLSGDLEVKGRSRGESLQPTAVRSDKLIIAVDTLSYIRIPIDYQDDWTAPTYRAELSRNMGTAHAKFYDEAHTIQLIKATDFVPPPTLQPTFNPLTDNVVPLNLTTGSEEDAANELVHAIKAAANRFLTEKDIPVAELVLLIDPAWFSILMEHKKLMNVRYSRDSGNDYAWRRVGYVAGVRVIELNSYPQEAITAHELGADYDVTAEEAMTRATLFKTSSVLLTVEAQSVINRQWDDEREMTMVMDSYRLFNVGLRRPDCVINFRQTV